MEISRERKEAACKFATVLQKYAENGNIEAISITVNAWSSDEIFKVAEALGIKDVSVQAVFGS